MKIDYVYIQDILSAITKIENYLNGVTVEGFYKNSEKQDAVIRQLEIIGEAAAAYHKFNPDNQELPWIPMISMRNKLIHEYHGVDLDTVWKTAWTDLPAVKHKLTIFLEQKKLPPTPSR
jgi:uncharacterized protein with HEPN domain